MYAYNSSSSLYLNMKKKSQNLPVYGNTSLVELFTVLWVSTGLMIRIQDTGSPSSVLLLGPWENHLVFAPSLVAISTLALKANELRG